MMRSRAAAPCRGLSALAVAVALGAFVGACGPAVTRETANGWTIGLPPELGLRLDDAEVEGETMWTTPAGIEPKVVVRLSRQSLDAVPIEERQARMVTVPRSTVIGDERITIPAGPGRYVILAVDPLAGGGPEPDIVHTLIFEGGSWAGVLDAQGVTREQFLMIAQSIREIDR